jgi:GDP/UDP-N,N'-diacetylbacillosamine 2-epimerase (hydrolysing)
MPRKSEQRRVCFVTGTRAEFGLMRTTLAAIRANPKLRLQIIATGMHLSVEHGKTVQTIRREGWKVDATVPWRGAARPGEVAVATGKAIAGLAQKFAKLKTEIVLVVGDRVEAFAAAAAGQIAGLVVAHVHGGDRALGQVDDSLRHAITKLSHIHFPATLASARRIKKLGEDAWRIHLVGSPGVDGILVAASSVKRRDRYALLVLHPTDTDVAGEARRAAMVLGAVRKIGFDQTIIVYPNNDPGSKGIIGCWESSADFKRETVLRDVSRAVFLALLRDAAVLVGNSSSGIIEAASFGTPVLDIGVRQAGRERSGNVKNVAFSSAAIERELQRIWNGGPPRRFGKRNVYGGNGAGGKIAKVMGEILVDDRLKRKLIVY